MCGLCFTIACCVVLVSAPSPPEVTEVPTNSTPRVCEDGLLKFAFRLHAQLLWTSPDRTTGFFMRRSRTKFRMRLREPTYPSQASTFQRLALEVSRSRWAKKTCWARTFQVAPEAASPLSSQLSCPAPVSVRAGSLRWDSVAGWSVRYWRVSSALNWARFP